MGFYARYVLPKIVHFACSAKPNMRQRAKVVPLARGRVLEIGAGSGLNLPFYDAGRVEHLFALEPATEMWAQAEERLARVSFSIEPVTASAEDIPLESGAVDTVLVTYSLCTIPDVHRALGEIRRVLRADGALVFCEHGLAPDESVRRWQRRLNPLWQRIGGGCNLDRDIPALIGAVGFRFDSLETMYLPGPRPATFNYWGVAR